MNFATLATLWQEYEERPRALAFQATNTAEWAAWHDQLRAKLVDLLGGLPTHKPPLQPILLEECETPAYRVEKIAFQSLAGDFVPCYVLTPHQRVAPLRAVIALHGHGSGGARHLLGLPCGAAPHDEEMAHIAVHNYDYAHQLAQQGFMVFVPEQRGLGARMEPDARLVSGSGLWQSSCRALAFNAMLMGKTVLGLRVWDVMRTLDYIATRPEVAGHGVGCVGLSGGGTTTLYASALDARITAAVISGAFGSFRTSIMSTIHCECNYIPGILPLAEMVDIAALIAPRAVLVENGTDDPIFPVAATQRALAELAQVYALLGVEERLASDIFVGGHRFSGQIAFAWLRRWL